MCVCVCVYTCVSRHNLEISSTADTPLPFCFFLRRALPVATPQVTPAFFEYLRSQQWATAYYMSAADRQAVALSGLLTLSRIPFAKVYLEEIPSGAKRTAVIARLDLCGASLTVANVQMDSPTKPQASHVDARVCVHVCC